MFTGKFIRIGAAYAMFSAMAWAQPSLTTISDVLFKADGRRFNGLAQFTWVSFESGNGSNIAMQTKTVRIIDGNLFVQLTPTTNAVPAAQYSVKYSSDGKIQFQETWAVPSSTTSLRVRDVRTTQPIFREITDGFDSESVIISLPRFKIETEFKLKPLLCALHADLTKLAVMWFARVLLNIHKFWGFATRADRYFRHHLKNSLVADRLEFTSDRQFFREGLQFARVQA